MDRVAVLPPVSSPGLPSPGEAEECRHSPFLSRGFDFQLDGIDLRTAHVFKRLWRQRNVPDRYIEIGDFDFLASIKRHAAQMVPGRSK